MDLTTARCLELADAAQQQASGALEQASDIGTRLATGTFLGPDPQAAAAGVGALTQVAGMKFIEGQYWLRRREAAQDGEDEQLDAESNRPADWDAYDQANSEIGDQPVIRVSVSGDGSLHIVVGSTVSRDLDLPALRQMFGEAGWLLMIAPLPAPRIGDGDG